MTVGHLADAIRFSIVVPIIAYQVRGCRVVGDGGLSLVSRVRFLACRTTAQRVLAGKYPVRPRGVETGHGASEHEGTVSEDEYNQEHRGEGDQLDRGGPKGNVRTMTMPPREVNPGDGRYLQFIPVGSALGPRRRGRTSYRLDW